MFLGNNTDIQKECLHRKINYVCSSLIYKKKQIIVDCNSKAWLSYYKKMYLESNLDPPIKKYIEATPYKGVIWELLDLDPLTQEYLCLRNKMVNVKTNLSLVWHLDDRLWLLDIGFENPLEGSLNTIRQEGLFLKRLFTLSCSYSSGISCDQ